MKNDTGTNDGPISYGEGFEPPRRTWEPWQRSIIRDVVIIGAVVVFGWALSLYAEQPNPDFALVLGLEEVFKTTLDGVAAEEAVAGNPQARLYSVERNGEPMHFLTHEQPVARGTCYGLRWQEGDLEPAAGRFFSDGSCVPRVSGTFATGFPALPSESATAWWFTPALMVLIAIGLFALVRIAVVALRPSRLRGG
jgi:hypothetical protein